MYKNIKVKRIYENVDKGDGIRILVDRLWPRGINKEKALIDFWYKDLAPSNELRKWYAHDPEKWQEFKLKYFKELDNNRDLCQEMISKKAENITLLYSAKELKYNNAVALNEYLVMKVVTAKNNEINKV